MVPTPLASLRSVNLSKITEHKTSNLLNMDITTEDDTYIFSPPCTDSLQYLNGTILVVVYIIVFCLSLMGNTVVIFVVFFMENHRASTDIYLMHLAIADLLFSLTLPFWAANLHASHWPFGTVMCKLVSGVQEATFYCCVFLLACISIDRYLAIVKATQFLSRQRHLVGAVCAAVWLCAILLSLPIVVHREAFVPNGMNDVYICHENLSADTIDDWRVGLRIVRHTVGFFLPLAVMIFGYSFTICTLCHSRNNQKQKAMRVILSVVLAFVICWLPNNITELLDTLMRGNWMTETCELRDSLDVALYVTQAVAFTHCAINPILYAFIGKKFRNQLLMSLFKKGLLGRETLSKYRVGSVYSSVSSRQMSVTL
ncbi:C-X-C chemokine receptor type 1 isoform X2 [Myxocyprinus asiaticus]|uniref:C-X-C chemokine receptor type 1 isoform X2 n=1 Tax=Myxocyprinus asiaticus TaxID=70543 RepID=UPI002221CDF7|nr:C-X-C chemokine receptor type 1 isoform X2 [Myxocyprinus asiaticus]